MQRVGIVQQRLLDADAERGEQEARLDALRVHQLRPGFGLAVRGVDRLELAERGTDVVAGLLASEVVVEAARSGDRVEGGVRDELEDLPVEDHAPLAADLGPLHELRPLRREMADEGVGRLVVVVVCIEHIEVDGSHGYLTISGSGSRI